MSGPWPRSPTLRYVTFPSSAHRYALDLCPTLQDSQSVAVNFVRKLDRKAAPLNFQWWTPVQFSAAVALLMSAL